MAFTDEELERYSRQIILPDVGYAGQKRLADGSVLVIGAGGLGSPAAMYLAAAGVGRIGLADADTVSLSNLQRQIVHFSSDLGKRKVDSAAEKLHDINPHIEVDTHPIFVKAENVLELIEPYDFIVDATDNFPAKFLINDACVIAGKPFSHAGIMRFRGQLMTYVPGEGPCYRCVFNEPPAPGTVPSCREAGVVGAIAGVVGSMQAIEAVKYLTGAGQLLTNTLLSFDTLTMQFHRIPLRGRDARCAVCGDHPTILVPFDYEQPACAIPAGKDPQ